MLATGTHDGILKIWTAEVPPRGEGESPSAYQAPSRSSSPEHMFFSDEERVESPRASPGMEDGRLFEKGMLKLQMGGLGIPSSSSGGGLGLGEKGKEKDLVSPSSPTETVQKEKRPLAGLGRLRTSYFGGKKKDGVPPVPPVPPPPPPLTLTILGPPPPRDGDVSSRPGDDT